MMMTRVVMMIKIIIDGKKYYNKSSINEIKKNMMRSNNIHKNNSDNDDNYI